MPVATTSQEGERHDLKSLPEAFVVVKRMTYGQKLRRLEMASKMSVDMNRKDKSVKGEMEMMQYKAALYDFRSCIVQHNLEKKVGEDLKLLDFNNETDFLILDPRVGDEINQLLDKLNNFEDNKGN
jgi:hypothetical protein